MTISYEKFHLKEVINASGKMTLRYHYRHDCLS